MGIFSQYEIPYLHPVVVHFPIALFVVGAIAAVLWLMTENEKWYTAYAFMHIAGTIGAVAAFFSGESLHDDSTGVPVVELFVERHELFGKTTLILALVILVLLAVSAFRARMVVGRRGPDRLVRISIVVLAVVLAVITGLTAHLGGLMVWGIPTAG